MVVANCQVVNRQEVATRALPDDWDVKKKFYSLHRFSVARNIGCCTASDIVPNGRTKLEGLPTALKLFKSYPPWTKLWDTTYPLPQFWPFNDQMFIKVWSLQHAPHLELRLRSQSVTIQNCLWMCEHTTKLLVTQWLQQNSLQLCDVLCRILGNTVSHTYVHHNYMG